MKIILVIIDGLGDKAVPQLGNKTPLESAKTPNLDWLAANGVTGLVASFHEKGKLPTSEKTHLALFGYNPAIFNPGRGVFEVLGLGMKVSKHDVCLRGNFATLDPEKSRFQRDNWASPEQTPSGFNGVNKKLKIIDRRAGRIKKTEELIKAISGIKIEGVKFLIKKSVSHRIGIVMRGDGLSPRISDGDPKKVGVQPLKILPREKNKKAVRTARILNEFLERCRLILEKHPSNRKRKKPANFILVRGAGSLKEIPTFYKKYKMRACCIAGGALYKGIGKFLGMDIIRIKGANALPTTNLKGKIQAVKSALKKLAPYRPAGSGTGAGYDFVFCHIKAADNLAEDGDFRGKKEFIEKIDQKLAPLLKLKDVVIIITGDHSTCSCLKRHCLEPVPILVFFGGSPPKKLALRQLAEGYPTPEGEVVRSQKIEEGREAEKKIHHFSEKTCKEGKLGEMNQIDFLSIILRIARK